MLALKLLRNLGVILLAFGVSSTAVAQSAVVTVPGNAQWTNTGLDVVKGDLLTVTATGTWTEGGNSNGPEGITKPWPDNFFNIADLGVCMYCATSAASFWGALIGYVGSSPPAAGSYTSATIFPETTKIFLVGKSYAAKAPGSGRLWLNKNTDAYSNYTVDNGGQVTATTTVSPPETEEQYNLRMHKSIDSIKAPLWLNKTSNNTVDNGGKEIKSVETPTKYEEAASYCVRATLDHWQDESVKWTLKAMACGIDPACNALGDVLYLAGDIYDTTVKVTIHFQKGDPVNVVWDIGLFVVSVLSNLPGATGPWFAVLGDPALYCGIAGLWLTGEIGAQWGKEIREKFLVPNASIEGTWTLNRDFPIECKNFEYCRSTPIPILISNCIETGCAISRSDGDWQNTHTIVRDGDTWVADFDDIGIECPDDQNVIHPNVAHITIELSITSADNLGKVAKSVGGDYTVQADSNPPCNPPGHLYARYDLHGNR